LKLTSVCTVEFQQVKEIKSLLENGLKEIWSRIWKAKKSTWGERWRDAVIEENELYFHMIYMYD